MSNPTSRAETSYCCWLEAEVSTPLHSKQLSRSVHLEDCLGLTLIGARPLPLRNCPLLRARRGSIPLYSHERPTRHGHRSLPTVEAGAHHFQVVGWPSPDVARWYVLAPCRRRAASRGPSIHQTCTIAAERGHSRRDSCRRNSVVLAQPRRFPAPGGPRVSPEAVGPELSHNLPRAASAVAASATMSTAVSWLSTACGARLDRCRSSSDLPVWYTRTAC